MNALRDETDLSNMRFANLGVSETRFLTKPISHKNGLERVGASCTHSRFSNVRFANLGVFRKHVSGFSKTWFCNVVFVNISVTKPVRQKHVLQILVFQGIRTKLVSHTRGLPCVGVS